ncbi:MAG: DivIVA domain-containing protein [Oscillospiraceae bacterium]
MDMNILKQIKFDQNKRLGYDIDQVDRFINDIIKEFEDQDKQMAVLASKLQDYKEDENSLKTILLNAQKLADTIVKEAREKADIILRDTRIKSETLVEKTAELREKEEEKLNILKGEISDFKISILKMYKNHIEAISSIPEYEEEIEEDEEFSYDNTELEDEKEMDFIKELDNVIVSSDDDNQDTEEDDDTDQKSEKFDFSNLKLEDEFTEI